MLTKWVTDDYDVDIVEATSISLEITRTRFKKGDEEIPKAKVVISIMEDGQRKARFTLLETPDYGVFSYTSNEKRCKSIQLAIGVVEFIAMNLMQGFDQFAYKVQKKITSDVMVYEAIIPQDYEISFPDVEEDARNQQGAIIRAGRKRAEIARGIANE